MSFSSAVWPQLLPIRQPSLPHSQVSVLLGQSKRTRRPWSAGIPTIPSISGSVPATGDGKSVISTSRFVLPNMTGMGDARRQNLVPREGCMRRKAHSKAEGLPVGTYMQQPEFSREARNACEDHDRRHQPSFECPVPNPFKPDPNINVTLSLYQRDRASLSLSVHSSTRIRKISRIASTLRRLRMLRDLDRWMRVS